jgi:hypothetical protein
MNKWGQLLEGGQIEGITYQFPDFCAMKGRYHVHVTISLIQLDTDTADCSEDFQVVPVSAQNQHD